MTWQQRWTRLARSVQPVQGAAAAEALIDRLVPPRRSEVLAFVNAHAMNLAAEQATFFESLAGADILLRDGVGMAILFKFEGGQGGENMNGTDFIPRLLATCGREGQKVALWGSTEPCAHAAAHQATRRWCAEVVSVEGGFAPDEHYVAALERCAADVVVLGMGMPKQERIAVRLRAAAAKPTLIVCGGAIIDFLSGNVSRAPSWVRSLRAEWVYRLCREPRRLFRRYVIGNPMFLWRLARWRPEVSR